MLHRTRNIILGILVEVLCALAVIASAFLVGVLIFNLLK